MKLATRKDLAIALERLRRRDPEQMAQLLLSLAHDLGPIGDQIRTFIVTDDLEATAAAVMARIKAVSNEPRGYRRREGRIVAERMGYIVDAIETLLLPRDAQGAFDVLVQLIERDGASMEACGDYTDEVATAIERAIGLLLCTAPALPADEVRPVLERLAHGDHYGTRRMLQSVLESVDGLSFL